MHVIKVKSEIHKYLIGEIFVCEIWDIWVVRYLIDDVYSWIHKYLEEMSGLL